MNEGWKMIPMPGAVVTSSHPRTTMNPTKYFQVIGVKVGGSRAYARGEHTIWFNTDMLTAAPEGAVEGDKEPWCTYPDCKCIVSTSTTQPEPECPHGKD